jgi:predicted GNAT family acetyltransferase
MSYGDDNQNQSYDGYDRRENSRHHQQGMYYQLREEDIEAIAERAAIKAQKKIMDNFYTEVGRSVVKKVLVIVGLAALAAWAYFERLWPFTK